MSPKLRSSTTVNISGTVGAAVEGAREGFPAIAFSASGSSTSQVSYTTLGTNPTSTLSVAARIYANLTATFVGALLAAGGAARSAVPVGTIVNVNYPAIGTVCMSAESFEFVFARLLTDANATDAVTCGTNHLPSENDVVGAQGGCYASVSVVNATNKGDVDAATQSVVLERLEGFLSCI
jgi:5'-nucleotidase